MAEPVTEFKPLNDLGQAVLPDEFAPFLLHGPLPDRVLRSNVP